MPWRAYRVSYGRRTLFQANTKNSDVEVEESTIQVSHEELIRLALGTSGKRYQAAPQHINDAKWDQAVMLGWDRAPSSPQYPPPHPGKWLSRWLGQPSGYRHVAYSSSPLAPSITRASNTNA